MIFLKRSFWRFFGYQPPNSTNSGFSPTDSLTRLMHTIPVGDPFLPRREGTWWSADSPSSSDVCWPLQVAPPDMRIHPPTQWLMFSLNPIGSHTNKPKEYTRIPTHELGSITKAAYLILKTSGQKAGYQCTMSPFLQGMWIRIPWVLLKPLSLGLRKQSELPPVPFGVMVGIHSTTTAFFNNPAYIPLMKMKSFYSYGTTYIFLWHLTSVCHSYWISVSQLETSKL